MKVRIVFEREGASDTEEGKLVFKGFFGEDGEPVPEEHIDGEGWIADGDVEAFGIDVYSK